MICLLRIVHGPLTGQQRWLRDDQIVSIGRLSTSDFAIPTDMHLSRRHLMIEGLGDNFRLRDVGSSNGTFVNNVKISVTGLCNHDLIRAGESVFEVTFHVERPGDALDFEDPRATPTVYSDSSPTSYFSGSLLDDLPVRSLNANPPKIDGANSILPDSNSPKTAQSDEPENEVPVETEPTRDHSGLFLDLLNTSGFPFSETETCGLFQMACTKESGSQPVLDIFEIATKQFNCCLVINQSQLPRRVVSIVESLHEIRSASQISQTLVAIPLDLSPEAVQLLRSCLKLDALILVGLKDSIPDQGLDSIADVLSYPSMLDGLLGAEKSRLAKRLRDYVDFALFESSSPQGIKLLLPHLATAKS